MSWLEFVVIDPVGRQLAMVVLTLMALVVLALPDDLRRFAAEHPLAARFSVACVLAFVGAAVLCAQPLYAECNWDTLVSTYGEYFAWVMWIQIGCYW